MFRIRDKAFQIAVDLCWLTAVFLCLNVILSAAPPTVYKTCGFYELKHSQIIASDNESAIVLINNNEILSLEMQSFDKNWNFEVPGRLIGKPSLKNGLIFVESQAIKADNKLDSGNNAESIETNESINNYALTVLNAKTGIPIKKEVSFANIPENAEIESADKTKNLPDGYSAQTVTAQTQRDDLIVTGHSNGEILLADANTRTVFWKAKAGGQISGLVFTDEGVLASSFDNFLYHLKNKSANRIWKKRFPGRISGLFEIDKNSVAVQVLESNFASVLEIEKGTEIGRIELKNDEAIKQIDSIDDKTLILTSAGGIYKYSSGGCAK